MYTPHQKGVHSVSAGDIETVNWLYKLPQGATPKEIASRYNVSGSDLDEIIEKIVDKNAPSEFERVKDTIKIPKRDLLEENENIGLIHRYHISLQNVNLSPKANDFFKKQAAKKGKLK